MFHFDTNKSKPAENNVANGTPGTKRIKLSFDPLFDRASLI